MMQPTLRIVSPEDTMMIQWHTWTVCVKNSLGQFALYKNSYLFLSKRADSIWIPRKSKSYSGIVGSPAFRGTIWDKNTPRPWASLSLSVIFSRSLLSPLFCLLPHCSVPLSTGASACVYRSVCVRMWLPKHPWQLQIKMGGVCTALSPCNAKGVECHKSPFDLSNQLRSCSMQTFVIGGRGLGGWRGNFRFILPLHFNRLQLLEPTCGRGDGGEPEKGGESTRGRKRKKDSH